MFDPRPLYCSSLTTTVGGTKDTNIVDSESPYRGTNQLAMVFACEKFRPYILGSHVIIHTNHVAIKYLMAKKDAKPRLIRWVLDES